MNHDATWPSGRVATGFDEALVDGDGAEAFWANLGQYDDPPGVGEPSRHMVRQTLDPALRARAPRQDVVPVCARVSLGPRVEGSRPRGAPSCSAP